jgi:hypothetical protein
MPALPPLEPLFETLRSNFGELFNGRLKNVIKVIILFSASFYAPAKTISIVIVCTNVNFEIQISHYYSSAKRSLAITEDTFLLKQEPGAKTGNNA